MTASWDPNQQPGQPYPSQPVAQPPNNYLVWAILSTVLCCLPLGVVSIVFSTQVNSKWAMGDVAGAQDASKKAKQFALWALIVGVVVEIVVVIFYGALIMASLHAAS